MNKRIVSFLCVFLLVFGSMTVFAADSWFYDWKLEAIYGDTAGKKEDNTTDKDVIQKLLEYLKISDETQNVSDEISMVDFLSSLAVIQGSDVYEFQSYLEKETGMSFSTDKPTFAHAACAAVVMTGYGYKVKASNYISVAQEKDLFNGITVNSQNKLTVREANQLYYNILVVPCYGPDQISDKNTTYSQLDIPTILEFRFGLVQRRGILNAVNITNMYGVSDLEDGIVEIDRAEYKTGETDCTELFGQRVVAFVKSNDDNLAEEIAVIAPYKNEIVEFNGNDIVKINGTKIETEEENIRFKSDSKVIYNGVYYGNATYYIENFKGKNALIKSIDNDGDKIVDVFDIWEYKSFVAKTSVGSTGSVNFKYGALYGNNASVILGEKGNWDYIDVLKDGESIDYTEISVDDVVSVASCESASGKKKIRVIVSKKTETGTIETIEKEDGIVKITINGRTYDLSKDYQTLCGYPNGSDLSDIPCPAVGKKFTLHIAYDNTIAGVSKLSDTIQWAYLVNAGKDEDSFGEGKGMVKIFGTDAKFHEYTFADKVNFYDKDNMNGVRMNGIDVAKKILEPTVSDSTYDIRDVICYKLNDDDIITDYFKVVDNRDGTPGSLDYPCTYDADPTGWFYHNKFVQTNWIHTSNITFQVPGYDNRDEETLYRIIVLEQIEDLPYAFSGIKLYGADKFRNAKILVYPKEQEAGINMGLDTYVIANKKNAVNSEGEKVLRFEAYDINGNLKNIDFDDDTIVSTNKSESNWIANVKASNLKVGDIVTFKMDAAGRYVEDFIVYFQEANRGKYRHQNGYGDTISGAEEMGPLNGEFSYAQFKDSTSFTEGGREYNIIEYTDGKTTLTNYTLSRYVDAGFMLYDSGTQKVSVIDFGDLVSGDDICVRRYYPGIKMVVVYR